MEAIQKQLNVESNKAAAISQQYTGLIHIYNSTCIVGNKRDMDNVRAQIHDCMDQLLDANARIFMLTRKLAGLD